MSRKKTRADRRAASTLDNPLPAAGALPDDPTDLPVGGEDNSPARREEVSAEKDIIDQLRQEAGAGAYVRIYRRKLGQANEEWLQKMSFSEYSMDRVSEIFGGGDYRITVHAVKEGRHFQIKQLSYVISHDIPSKHPAAAGAAAAAAAAPAGTDLVELAKVLKQAQAPAGDGGMAVMMPLLIAMMNSNDKRFEVMMTKLSDRQTGPDPITMKLLEMQLGKERTPVSELLESFNAFKKITGSKGGDDDEEEKSPLEKLVGALTPLAEGLFERYMSATPAPGGEGQPAITAGAAAGATIEEFPNGQPRAVKPIPQRQPPPGAQMNLMQLAMQAKLKQIQESALAAAQQNADPEEFVDLLLDDIPPKYNDQIFQKASAPDWFEQLAGFDPAAQQYREWITKVRDILLRELAPEAE